MSMVPVVLWMASGMSPGAFVFKKNNNKALRFVCADTVLNNREADLTSWKARSKGGDIVKRHKSQITCPHHASWSRWWWWLVAWHNLTFMPWCHRPGWVVWLLVPTNEHSPPFKVRKVNLHGNRFFFLGGGRNGIATLLQASALSGARRVHLYMKKIYSCGTLTWNTSNPSHDAIKVSMLLLQ